MTALLRGDAPRVQAPRQQVQQTPPQQQPVEAPIPRLTPPQAAEAALADCKRLPFDAQQNAVYFWAGPVADLRVFARVFTFHVNSLSRESDLVVPQQVRPDLWRVDIRDYGWNKGNFDKLAEVDPYFHQKLQAVLVPTVVTVGTQVVTAVACQACFWGQNTKIFGEINAGTAFEVRGIDGDLVMFDSDQGQLGVPFSAVQILQSGSNVQKVTGQKPQNIAATAQWLPAATMGELISLTQNQAPLLRADWFFAQTCRQIDLNNLQVVGYYDFLGIKTEKDVEELAGLDRKLVEKLRRERRAIIPDSDVTLHNRQIAADQDGYWESLDVESNQGNANAKRQLDKDYVPVAKEVYFRLPNGLWGLAAINAKNGQVAASVPDTIAADKKSTSNDHRIQASLGCVRCHVEGLRPLDDWARKFYAAPPGDVKLVALEYERLRRLKQLYLGPLQDRYDDDQRFYARTLMRLVGWTPKEMANAYAAAWVSYAETPVTGQQLARELGTDYDAMIAALKRYVAPSAYGGGGSQDPVVTEFLKKPEFPNRREYIEETYILFQFALIGQVKK